MKNQKVTPDIQRALKKSFPLYPIFDVTENEGHYVLYIDARAILANELDIQLCDGNLVIKGRGEYNEEKAVESLVVRSNGSNVVAQYKDGLLLVALKKNVSEKLSLLCA